MPQLTIPLVPTYDGRPFKAFDTVVTNGKGARAISCFFEIVPSKELNSKSIYVCKRPGFIAQITPSAGNAGKDISEDGIVIVFGASFTVFYNAVNCGNVDGQPCSIRRVLVGGEGYYMIPTLSSGSFYLAENATGTATFTGDTHTNTTIDNVSSLTGLYVGQAISGTNIAANTRIDSISY